MIRRACAVILVAACGHSEPFVTADQEIAGPFASAEPLRLTYSPLGDHQPSISADGAWLTYQFERPSPDRDRCIAIMPAAGGQRQRELCAWQLDEATSADGLANAALRSDGMIAFTMHSGLIGNMTSPDAGLYLAPADSLAGATRIMAFPSRPAGAGSVWEDLVDPVWVSNDELLVLAGDRFLANATGACDPLDCNGDWVPYDMDRTPLRDTIVVGVELARIRITAGAAMVVSTMPVPSSGTWSFDPSNGTAYVVSRHVHPLDDFVLESLADTVYAVNPALGQLTMRYGTSRISGNRSHERIHGIASGRGRVFVSRSWRGADAINAPNILPGALLTSDIAELLPDGTLQPLVPAVSWRWGRLRLSPDGHYLYAEAVERIGGDIYRIEIGS